MSADLVVILDDREAPPPSVAAALGTVRFADIMRRRMRLEDQLRVACAEAGKVLTVRDADTAAALAEHIEDRGPGVVYLRLPLAIAPSRLEEVPALIMKARFALETMFVGPIFHDDAPMLLFPADAVRLLRAGGADARRALLLRLTKTAPAMVETLGLMDLRRPRSLLRFLSGATEARHFNEAVGSDGVFRKSSTDVAKMRAEHDFFHVAPAETKRFLLPTFGYWEKDGRAGYAMEHLTVPDVALQFVHGAFSPEEFELLLDQFFAFIKTRKRGETDRPRTIETGRVQIVGKLEARLDALMDMPEGRKLDAILKVAGPIGGVDAMRVRATPLVEAALERDGSQCLVFGHGDPCFSNILFDRRLGLMRLVDPRGAISEVEGMAHPLYDVAKFSHSVLGGYDFVNNGLATSELDPQLALRLIFASGGPAAEAGLAFRRRVAEAGFDLWSVRGVELSLFLSMLPLHHDHPQKMAGYALIAGRIIEELEAA